MSFSAVHFSRLIFFFFFKAPREHNKRSWLYRIRPSAVHKPFSPVKISPHLTQNWDENSPNPNQVYYL
jgi:homogentisate 1,2-dioxygenase